MEQAFGAIVSRLSTAERLIERLGVREQALSLVPAVRAYASNPQTIANNTVTALTLTVEDYDTNGIHDNSTNTSRLTCRVAGLYLIDGTLQFVVSGAGTLRSAYIRVNGTTYITQDAQPPSALGSYDCKVTDLWSLAVGDYVELIAFQDTGGNLNTSVVAQRTPVFWMVRVGATS